MPVSPMIRSFSQFRARFLVIIFMTQLLRYHRHIFSLNLQRCGQVLAHCYLSMGDEPFLPHVYWERPVFGTIPLKLSFKHFATEVSAPGEFIIYELKLPPEKQIFIIAAAYDAGADRFHVATGTEQDLILWQAQPNGRLHIGANVLYLIKWNYRTGCTCHKHRAPAIARSSKSTGPHS